MKDINNNAQMEKKKIGKLLFRMFLQLSCSLIICFSIF